MEQEFHDRFEEYRVALKIKNKPLSKSEFGRFIFHFWEMQFIASANDPRVTKLEQQLKEAQEQLLRVRASMTNTLPKVG